jgi:hypothetical protein
MSLYSRENEYMSTGRRQGSCEWKAKATIFSKRLGHWVFTILQSSHNHFFSALPANIPANRCRHRIRIESIIENIERQRKQPNINSSDIVKNKRKDVLNNIHPHYLFPFKDTDNNGNFVARRRRGISGIRGARSSDVAFSQAE